MYLGLHKYPSDSPKQETEVTTILLFTFTHEILFHSFNIKKNPETTKYTKVYV